MNQVKSNIPPKPKTGHPAPQKDSFDDDELEGGGQFVTRNVMPSWLVSFLAHVAIILVLALLVLPLPIDNTITVDAGQGPADVEEVVMNLDSLQLDSSDALEAADMSEMSAPEMTDDLDFSFQETELVSDIGQMIASEDAFDAGQSSGNESLANETSGRTGDAKRKALLANGGNQASEDAVQLALKWIVAHQLEDGSWDLDHTIGPGNHRDSPNPGTRPGTRNGATALALLPLLGAGHTHLSGEHKKAVHYGLEYLKKKSKQRGTAISLMDDGGELYSHGLCAIVFNEAYAMTQDPELRVYAQGSLYFTEQAQHGYGGGWRYRPGERGDTSAVGWQLMALKSGKITGLRINPKTYKKAAKFLDSVSDSQGSFYGYQFPPRPGTRPVNARTAVGLLCRMYLGWDRDVPGLVDGMDALAEEGPSTGPMADMYYNYYATQAMKHMYLGQNEWKSWNTTMRDFLIQSQSKRGNSAGSWHFGEKDFASQVGGRLYNTSMACMTLEVYYRFLPLYSNKATDDAFELLE